MEINKSNLKNCAFLFFLNSFLLIVLGIWNFGNQGILGPIFPLVFPAIFCLFTSFNVLKNDSCLNIFGYSVRLLLLVFVGSEMYLHFIKKYLKDEDPEQVFGNTQIFFSIVNLMMSTFSILIGFTVKIDFYVSLSMNTLFGFMYLQIASSIVPSFYLIVCLLYGVIYFTASKVFNWEANKDLGKTSENDFLKSSSV